MPKKLFKFVAVAADSPKDIHQILGSRHRWKLQNYFKRGHEIFWMTTELLEKLEDETPPENRFGDKELFLSGVYHLISFYEVDK